MKSTFKIEGLTEFDELLKQMPPAVARRAANSALRAGGDIIAKDAKTRVPVLTGDLKKSIKVRSVKESKKYKRLVRIGVSGTEGPLAHIIEFGTAKIRKAKGRVMRFVINGQTLFRKQVKGVDARPFLRPAFDTQISAALDAISAKLAERIPIEANKLALQKAKRAAKRGS